MGQNLGWRAVTSFAALHSFIAAESRAADLIVTSLPVRQLFQGWTRHASVGALAVCAGRPVFVVPEDCAGLTFSHAVVGWKETRETRRAASDALPLLCLVAQVTVVEISAGPDASRRLDDVAGWLGRQGVRAGFQVATPCGSDAARLRVIAAELGAGVLVAGAYGHSRP